MRPPSFPFGLFSHHSNRDNSLQDYPSFAGETVGTRIDRDNSLIMPLRLRGGYATECHAFSYFSSSSALIFSPPCGSCSVFEVAHSVNKYALKEYPFGCGCPTLVIPRERGDRGNLAVRRTHQADNFAVIYIISFPGDVSTSLNMTIGCGCPTPCHSEGTK